MDIQIPVIDGYQAVEALKIKGYLVPPPLILNFAHALPEERIQTQLTGFTGHLTKPIETQALVKMISLLAETES